MGIRCGIFGCVMVVLGVRVVVVAEGVRFGSVLLDLCGGLVFCMNLLGCLVRRALDNCLNIDFDMSFHKRVSLHDLGRL